MGHQLDPAMCDVIRVDASAKLAHGIFTRPPPRPTFLAPRSDHRVIGLQRIHHRCGSAHIFRRHEARVDLGQLVEYFRVGADGEPRDGDCAAPLVSRFGWNVSQWWIFETWRGADPERIYED